MNPLENAFKRLYDARIYWDQASRNYFDPNLFRMNVNAVIQALRSVTFLLQKNKSLIYGFDPWYQGWQEKMKQDSALKWLVTARNVIVKEGDLNLSSILRVSIIVSYKDEEVPEFQTELHPRLSFKHIHKAVKNSGLPHEILNNSYIRVERRWVDKEYTSQELLDRLSYCWVYFFNLLSDAPCSDINLKDIGESINSPPLCMPPNSETRSIWLRFTNDRFIGTELNKLTNRVTDKHFNKKITRRYKGSPMLNTAWPDDFIKLCEFYFDSAKWVMEKDGFHIFLVVFLKGHVPIAMRHLFPNDQADKFRMMIEIAPEVRVTKADGIITVSEAWIAEPDSSHPYRGASEYPNKSEVLVIIAANKMGDRYAACAPITRHGLLQKKTKLGPTTLFDHESINILEPVFKVWT